MLYELAFVLICWETSQVVCTYFSNVGKISVADAYELLLRFLMITQSLLALAVNLSKNPVEMGCVLCF